MSPKKSLHSAKLERKKHIQPRFKEIQDKIQTENNHFENSDFESRQGER